MYSLSLKDEQLAKLEDTQKLVESLTGENKVLKNKLAQTEGSLGELNRSLVLKDEQLAKLDKNSSKIIANDLKQENNELKDKVKETENLLEELKKSVTFRKQGSGEDDQLAETKEEVVSPNEKDSTVALENLNEQEAARAAINQWVKSWASKDVETYIASYAPEFKPSRGLSRSAWEKGRRKRLSSPTFIMITISNVETCFKVLH